MDHVHRFTPLTGRRYFKEDGKKGPFGRTYDQSVEYMVLYCPDCTETKEVVAADHRRAD